MRSSQRLDAFDQWCLRHILRVPFTAHVTNQEVRLRSAQPPVTQTVMLRRLRFFGHVIRSDSDEDHTRAVNASMTRRRSGNDLVVALVIHGCTPSSMTSNISTWGCGRPGTELMRDPEREQGWRESRGMRSAKCIGKCATVWFLDRPLQISAQLYTRPPSSGTFTPATDCRLTVFIFLLGLKSYILGSLVKKFRKHA